MGADWNKAQAPHLTHLAPLTSLLGMRENSSWLSRNDASCFLLVRTRLCCTAAALVIHRKVLNAHTRKELGQLRATHPWTEYEQIQGCATALFTSHICTSQNSSSAIKWLRRKTRLQAFVFCGSELSGASCQCQHRCRVQLELGVGLWTNYQRIHSMLIALC